MNPLSVDEWIRENGFESMAAQIKEAIKVDKEYRAFKEITSCAVCGETLTAADMYHVSPRDFNRTCFKHREFGALFDLTLIKKLLGYDL